MFCLLYKFLVTFAHLRQSISGASDWLWSGLMALFAGTQPSSWGIPVARLLFPVAHVFCLLGVGSLPPFSEAYPLIAS